MRKLKFRVEDYNETYNLKYNYMNLEYPVFIEFEVVIDKFKEWIVIKDISQEIVDFNNKMNNSNIDKKSLLNKEYYIDEKTCDNFVYFYQYDIFKIVNKTMKLL